MASKELTQSAVDLCEWGQEEGLAMFVIHTTDNGRARIICPQLPPSLVAKMLRSAADGYEEQVSERTIQ